MPVGFATPQSTFQNPLDAFQRFQADRFGVLPAGGASAVQQTPIFQGVPPRAPMRATMGFPGQGELLAGLFPGQGAPVAGAFPGRYGVASDRLPTLADIASASLGRFQRPTLPPMSAPQAPGFSAAAFPSQRIPLQQLPDLTSILPPNVSQQALMSLLRIGLLRRLLSQQAI